MFALYCLAYYNILTEKSVYYDEIPSVLMFMRKKMSNMSQKTYNMCTYGVALYIGVLRWTEIKWKIYPQT